MLSFEQAKGLSSIDISEIKLESNNIIELLDNKDELSKVRKIISERCRHKKPSCYYVNNVSSTMGAPQDVGNIMCNTVYCWESFLNESVKGLDDLVGWIINELWYYSYVLDGVYIDEVDIDVIENEVELFYLRCEARFDCFPSDEPPFTCVRRGPIHN